MSNSYQLSAISYQLPAASCQLPAIGKSANQQISWKLEAGSW
jgi:hypothetical protein